MMNAKQMIKRANSKGNLVKAIISYQQALMWYANESHWAVKGDEIIWLGDDDPTRVAEIVLGKRKPEPVRKPDKSQLEKMVTQEMRNLSEKMRKEYQEANERLEHSAQQTGGEEGNGGSPENLGAVNPDDAGREIRGYSDKPPTWKASEEQGGVSPDDIRVQQQPSDQLDQLGTAGVSDSSPDGVAKPSEAS